LEVVVTVITPLLYATLSDRDPDRVPGPDPREVAALRDRVGDLGWVLDEFRLDRFLQPLPMRDAVATGQAGVLLYTHDEVRDLLDGFATEGDPGGPFQWWELWPCADGRFALFPGDADEELAVAVVLPLAVDGRRRVQLRRLDLGVKLKPSGSVLPAQPPSAPPTPCTFEQAIDEPGAPYRGSCQPTGCPGRCRALSVTDPDRGLVIVTACAC
jgi:hypothetical protein